ncbi:MAG: hypothetical protein GEV28_34400 [Actinophytocola sp.]|nr:hypothetical protein [Actinophytocola sp.]
MVCRGRISGPRARSTFHPSWPAERHSHDHTESDRVDAHVLAIRVRTPLLADRTRLPRAHTRPSVLHPAATRPKSGCAGLTGCAVLRELQQLPVVMAGACHTCQRPFPWHTTT